MEYWNMEYRILRSGISEYQNFEVGILEYPIYQTGFWNIGMSEYELWSFFSESFPLIHYSEIDFMGEK
jgi:hypothetical protein